MCGRYFWTDDAEDAFDEDFPDLAGAVRRLRTGDYTPGMSAPALAAGTGSGICAEQLLWGFPGFDKGKLLINARAESVKDRPTFADSFAERRCALPAAGFYEWDKKKEKVIFTIPDKPILYLAGVYRPYGHGTGARPDAAHPLRGGSDPLGERCGQGRRSFDKRTADAESGEALRADSF